MIYKTNSHLCDAWKYEKNQRTRAPESFGSIKVSGVVITSLRCCSNVNINTTTTKQWNKKRIQSGIRTHPLHLRGSPLILTHKKRKLNWGHEKECQLDFTYHAIILFPELIKIAVFIISRCKFRALKVKNENVQLYWIWIMIFANFCVSQKTKICLVILLTCNLTWIVLD